MNKIPLAGTVWIASDIHLGPQTTATGYAFHEFLDQASTQADALLLNGDIFDAWIGDDFALNAPPLWLAQTLDKFRQVAHGIPLWLGRGNRDFLISRRLCEHVGARLLPEPCCLSTDYGDVLLTHGDEYCTGDAGYQRFRRLVRNPTVQRLFLSLNLTWRSQIADWARNRSKAANRYKAMDVMDVDPDSIIATFRRTGIGTMVHGHTHRPAVHRLQVDGLSRRRIVLPDWDYDHGDTPRGGWLAIDRNGARIKSLGALPPA